MAKRARLDGVRPEAPLVTDGTIGFDRSTREPYFSMGEGTHRVPMSMHAENRSRLCERLRRRADVPEDAVVFLQGGEDIPMHDTDVDLQFRQESNFQYLFGVKEPGCLGAVRVKDARALLFVPQLGEEYQAWCGPIKPGAWFHRCYAVDEVHLASEAHKVVSALGGALIVLGDRANRDSGITLPKPSLVESGQLVAHGFGSGILWDELNECRLVKSDKEVALLQYVNDVSSAAHIEVMRSIRGGQREHLAEATFRYQSALRGCFRAGYNCICGSGPRNAILHYGHAAEPNSEVVANGGMRLLDMGAEYHCYTADVTCTVPVSGSFTEQQRVVYEAVWSATVEVERRIRPGVDYKEMHKFAKRVMLEALRDAGLFVGDIDKMEAAGLMSFFMPHGLGHALGLDVHDVGGYEPGMSRKDNLDISENLRLGRKVCEGMVLTVEPGFYFVDYLVDKVLADENLKQFVNQDRLRDLWAHTGGVRIEDDVVVTSKGCRVLTCVPREVAEVEGVMAGQSWTISQACCREYTAAA